MSILEGSVERIDFRNERNNFTVARLNVGDARRRTMPVGRMPVVVGILPGVRTGEVVRLDGDWETHPRYGRNFKVDFCEVTGSATLEGLEKYLASGIVKGIGPKTATRIVARFREETLQVIENDPQQLTQVQGSVRAARWAARTEPCRGGPVGRPGVR
jgi:exodeoxyribonuclease V alpha subunit